MKKLLVLSSLLLFCITFVFAQEQVNEAEKSLQHDIGFNTIFILQGIFQSNQTPFSLMYKKYISEKQAIRFGIDAFFNLDNTSTFPGSSTYFNSSAASLSIAIGKEFQKPIDKRWTWYLGSDLVPFFSFNNQDMFQSGSLYSESESSSIGMSVRPFLGIRFNINPRLYLSAEANVGLQYSYTKNYINYIDNSEPYADTNGNNISLSMNPASGLFLYYRF